MDYRMLRITLVFDSCMENKFHVKAILELCFKALFPLRVKAVRQRTISYSTA
jgi:hypothetical protein